MTTTQDVGGVTTVTIDRTFATDLGRLWQMFTNPDDIAAWMGGNMYDPVTIDVDLRVGGVLHQRVTSKQDGRPWTFHGVFFDVREQERLEYSFEWKHDWREERNPSMVSIELSEGSDGHSSVHIEHRGAMAQGEAESTNAHWGNFLDALEQLL